MRIYTVRHGQTDLNVQKRMQGRHGLPLNATGIAQAERLADELKGVFLSAGKSRADGADCDAGCGGRHGREIAAV